MALEDIAWVKFKVRLRLCLVRYSLVQLYKLFIFYYLKLGHLSPRHKMIGRL